MPNPLGANRVTAQSILLILGMLVPILGMAQTYRCTEAGRTVYQATPCAGDGRAVDISPNAGVTGLKDEAERLKVKETKAAQQAARAPKATPPKRDREWYRQNCKAVRIGGVLARYEC